MRRSFSVTTITPEPASSATEVRPPTLLDAVEGEWVIASVRPSRTLTRGEQRLVASGRDAVLRVHDGNVRIVGGAFERSWNVTGVNGTQLVLAPADRAAEPLVVDVATGANALEVRLRSGVVTLRRQPR